MMIFNGWSLPPVTEPRLLDLDQMTAFITGGVFNIYSALSENADTSTGWWRAVRARTGGLFGRQLLLQWVLDMDWYTLIKRKAQVYARTGWRPH
jgi:hypothetical protein